MLKDADFNELLNYYPTLSDAPATLQFVLRQVGQCLQTTKNQIFFDVDTPCHTFAMLLSGSIRVISYSSTASGPEKAAS